MTTPAGSYSAGTVYLQVIPSYRDFMKNLRRDAQDIEKALKGELDKLDGIGSPLDTPKSKAKRAKAVAKAAREDAQAYVDAAEDVVEKADIQTPLTDPKARSKRKKAAADAGQEEAAEYAGRFRDTLQKSLARAERELKPIEIRSNAPEVKQQVDDLKVAIKAMREIADDTDIDLDSKDVHDGLVELEADFRNLKRATDDLEEGINLDAVEKAISGLRKEVATFRTEDERAAKAAAEAADKEAEARDRAAAAAERQAEAAKKKAEADKRAFESARIQRAKAALERGLSGLPQVARPVQAGSDGEMLASLQDQGRNLLDKTVGVDIDEDEYWRKFNEILLSVELLGALSADVNVGADAREFHATMAAVVAERDAVDGTKAEVKIDTNKDAAAHFDDLANNIRGFNGMILAAASLGPLLVPVLAALAGAALAAGAAFAGIGVGLGAMILGFSGIGSAVGAINDVQKNAAKDALVSGKALRGASNGIRDAQRGLDRAYQNAADAAEQSSRRQAQALRAQQDAEKSLQRAQRDVQKSQERLTRARKEASDQLEDMALRARGGALAERQALIDLFEAEVAYRSVMADPGSTNLEQEQASINLERQRIEIEGVRQANQRLAQEQVENANRDIEQTDAVIAAREGVVESQERVQDAQQRVADAREGVTQAAVDAARSERDSLQGVEDAQLRVADAQAAYADALVQANELGSASAQKLRDELAQLGPAGQAFAFFIAGLEDEFFQLRNAVQEGLLPGVQQAITNLLPYLPQITAFLGTMGGALGDLFVQASETFTSPVWLDFFEMLGEYAPIFMTLFGETLLSIFTVLAQLATAFAPLALDMAEGLVSILEGFSAYLASAEGQQMLQDFMAYVREAGPEVMKLLGALFMALINLAVALAPYAGQLIQAFTAFLNWVAGMDPTTLGVLVVGILGLVTAFQLLSGLLGGVGLVVKVLQGLGSVLRILGLTLPALTALGVGVVAAVLAVLAVLVIAYFKFEEFRNVVDAVFRAVAGYAELWFSAVSFYWNNILLPVLKAILRWLQVVLEFWTTVFSIFAAIVKKAFEAANKVWDEFASTGFGSKIIGYFSVIWDALGEGARKVWEVITDIFKGGVRLVISLINEGVIDPMNWLAEAVGADARMTRIADPFAGGGNSSRRTTGMQEFATGGWTGPGAKMQVAGIVHADEYVVRKESQRKMAEQFPGLLDYINQRGTLPGYAGGGLVDFGRLLQGRGFRVSEHPAFGGVRGRHTKGSQHYRNNAIDVNYGPGGTSRIEQEAIDGIIALASEYGLRTIWRTTGHYDHAHFDGGGGGNILGKLGGFVGGAFGKLKDAAGAVVGSPAKYLLGKVLDLPGIDTLKSSPVGKILLGPIQQALGWGVDWVKDKAGAVGDFFTGGKDDPPISLYDQGGWLPPGLSTVVNASGRPEPVFSAEQWEKIEAGGMGGGDTITIPVTQQNDPSAVADAILFAKRHLDRGGKYAGASG